MPMILQAYMTRQGFS